jgi:phosphatidylserine decarboxylase
MNSQYPHPIIAREGWPFLGISFGLALMVTGAGGLLWSWPLWVVFVFVLQFFRDPARPVSGDARSVLSPADGRIVAIEPTRDPWLDRDTLKISVFMNVFNVHSNRSPVDGEVKQRWYHRGAFVNAALAKASVENERNALHIRSTTGHDVTCVQVAGLVARRILCYVAEGTQLVRGQRYGFIRFGSRVDLYLPVDVRVKVAIGDKVRATTTLLAELP